MARKILLADDSVTAQNMGRRILTDAGYEVVTVNNGSAALKRIAESKPDLIVLDVYMPGYGGLEVCQRIRESQETARIPVLLTVGKLEPFKAEEVRRVRADAFIVKPFEASELLTALTKLEDKIVPQPKPYKPGRFAKAMAAIEESGIPEYGDPEKGWKNRLKIPPPDRKSHDDEAEETPVSSSQSRESRGTAVSPETSAAPTAAMLRGVTAEEIAAIEAAAEIFSGHAKELIETPGSAIEKPTESRNDQADSEGTSAAASETSVEAGANPPMTFATAPAAEPQAETSPAEVEPQDSTRAEVPTSEQAETFQVVPVEPATIESGAFSINTSENRAPEGEAAAEDEVAAALASLAPTNGHGVADSLGVAASREFSGPRWIAEAVPVTEDESAVTLDEEMQRTLAAFAAADAARAGMVSLEMEARASGTSESLPAMAVGWTAPAEESVAVPFASDAVAESTDATGQVAISEPKEVAAYAAAASAGAGAVEQNQTADMPSFGAPTEIPESTLVVDQQRESELAAAWASWKQVRDSVAGEQFTSQIADAAAAGLQDLPIQETTATPEPAPQASAAPEESGAIASIVDSVLAELKPRLMEEIARKMKK